MSISEPTRVGALGGGCNYLVAVGNYAYVAANFNGLRIIDISDKSSPTLAASFAIPVRARGIDVDAQHIYIAGEPDSLFILSRQ